jgi:hypothetical protein
MGLPRDGSFRTAALLLTDVTRRDFLAGLPRDGSFITD